MNQNRNSGKKKTVKKLLNISCKHEKNEDRKFKKIANPKLSCWQDVSGQLGSLSQDDGMKH